MDNKVTDKDIINVLNSRTNKNHTTIIRVFSEDGNAKDIVITIEDIVDLINRLNSENEILKELNQQVRKEKNKLMEAQLFLAKQCDKLQEKNDRQQETIKTLRNCVEQHHIIRKDGKSPLSLLTEEIKAEAIKEFAEKLKINYSKPLFAVGSYNEFIREVDNLVKEMVGDTE